MLPGIIALVVILGLAVLPQLWVSRVIRRHEGERDDFPGTGGEFARHLLDEMKLGHVKVERTDMGDHYDPDAKAVRLLPQHLDRRSLSAVVIAAHEVGHAMQDATGYAPLKARVDIARRAEWVNRAMPLLMIASIALTLFAKSPWMLLAAFAIGVVLQGFVVLLQMMSLPVEYDASFRRALPVLEAGHYIGPADMASARQILRAAAFTYVAAAAMNLLNVLRWMRW